MTYATLFGYKCSVDVLMFLEAQWVGVGFPTEFAIQVGVG